MSSLIFRFHCRKRKVNWFLQWNSIFYWLQHFLSFRLASSFATFGWFYCQITYFYVIMLIFGALTFLKKWIRKIYFILFVFHPMYHFLVFCWRKVSSATSDILLLLALVNPSYLFWLSCVRLIFNFSVRILRSLAVAKWLGDWKCFMDVEMDEWLKLERLIRAPRWKLTLDIAVLATLTQRQSNLYSHSTYLCYHFMIFRLWFDTLISTFTTFLFLHW